MQMKKLVLFFVLMFVVPLAISSLSASGASDPAQAAMPGANGKPVPTTNANFYDNGAPDPQKVELGQLLFFDKILSGNQNISCATCHHPFGFTGDGLALPIGEGGEGFGVTRTTGFELAAVHERVPRNAPHIFNLGAREFTRMFHDGRVEVDLTHPSGFRSPAGDNLPPGLDNVLAVQAMFPVTSGTEMAGQNGENPIGTASAQGDLPGVWALLAERLQGIPEYVERFVEVYDDVDGADDITFVHAANAIAAFEAVQWRADNSPFDRFLRGDYKLNRSQARGLLVFYEKAKCGTCHSGTFQTDQQFHAIAMPQIGPGKGHGNGHEDFGREAVTQDEMDRFKFRTPSLRNVALTGPWGHDGAFNTLKAVVLHHLDAVNSLDAYDTSQAVLPSRDDLDAIDFLVHNDLAARQAIADAQELEPVHLSDAEIDALLDFLDTLTDRSSLDLRHDVPRSVPSGLPLFD